MHNEFVAHNDGGSVGCINSIGCIGHTCCSPREFVFKGNVEVDNEVMVD